eukprot:TRINITY_DN5458_c0_g1_i4.p1 TRINITY_DN5458_c0_g1~~TRINITY_DN5458_c0_g1_i4.p1  ORF type:complete len:137 (-),score=40.19 TRINITY_DN5458_c0_g1_i4:17-427(-)
MRGARLWLMLALLVVVAHCEEAPEEEIDPEVRAEFNSLDTDGDGFLSLEEVLNYHEHVPQSMLNGFFHALDLDHDGKVTLLEFQNEGRKPAPAEPEASPTPSTEQPTKVTEDEIVVPDVEEPVSYTHLTLPTIYSV